MRPGPRTDSHVLLGVRRPYGVRVPVWGLRLVVRQGILRVVVSSTVVVGLPLCLTGVDHTSLLNLEAGGPGTTLTMALGRLLSHLANLSAPPVDFEGPARRGAALVTAPAHQRFI
jgi:hypothetical protein